MENRNLVRHALRPGCGHWRTTRRRVLAAAGFTLSFALVSSVSEEARACSPGEHVREYTTTTPSQDTTPPVLSAAKLSVDRGDPDGQDAACENLGDYTITVEASDDQTASDDLGFALTLVDGSFPFRVPSGTVIGNRDDGTLSDWFEDDGEAFDGTLEVRIVDRAGNVSEPRRVSASGDQVGCSCSAAGAPSTSYGWLVALALAACLVRRRSPAAKCAPCNGRASIDF